MNRPVELGDGYRRVKRIDASRFIAYKYAFGVYVESLDGTSRRRVFHDERCSVNCPLPWSPNGKTLYHAYDQVYAIDVASGASRALTAFPDEFSINQSLIVSPDGDWLVAYFENSIDMDNPCGQPVRRETESCFYAIRTDGSAKIKLKGQSHQSWLFTRDPDQFLLIERYDKVRKKTYVEAMNAKMEKGRRLVDLCGGLFKAFSVSPSGKNVVYGITELPENRYSGMRMTNGRTGKDLLVDAKGAGGRWCPDGSKVAYISEGAIYLWDVSTGRSELLVSVPGPAFDAPQFFDLDSRSYPKWSDDGRFLFFSLSKATTPIPELKDPDARVEAHFSRKFENRDGVVDLQEKKVFVVPKGYWEHASFQPVCGLV